MTFHHFSQLPFELRALIWHHSFPDVLGPTVYAWEKGQFKLSKEADRPSGLTGDHDVYFEFREDQLTGPLFALPTAYVNSEARTIAKAWIQCNAIKIHAQRDRDHPLFSRTMDETRDALYLHTTGMRSLTQEVLNRNYGIPYDDPLRAAPTKSPRFAIIIDGNDILRAWFGKFDKVLCSNFYLVPAVYLIVNDTVPIIQPPRRCGPAPFDVETADSLTDRPSYEWHNWNGQQLITSFQSDDHAFQAHLITLQNANMLPFAGAEMLIEGRELGDICKYQGRCGPYIRRYRIMPLLAVVRRVINDLPFVACVPGA